MAEPSFGTALRQLREQQGISLTALARLVHYSKGYLSKVETGERPATAVLARCCDEALGASGVLAGTMPGPVRRHRAAAHRPAQLPAGVAGFTGRTATLDQLDKALGTPAGALAVIVGGPGVGKTALALHWAHRVAGQFPDGCLFADLRGHSPGGVPAEPGEVLDGFLRGLNVPPEAIPADLGPRSALLRTVLDGKRMLIVLDNAASPAQVRPLLPGSPGCQVVVTSRSRMSGLVAREAAARVLLEPLPEDEAVTVLGHTLGSPRLAAERRAAGEIAMWCGFLPLALRIAADRAQARPRLKLAVLASELSAERERLDVLAADGDESAAVRSAFSWSYQALPHGAARMFRLLSLHPGPDVSIPAAAALAGVTSPQGRRLLESLTGVHLLEETDSGRYRFHDLLRLYSAERAHTEQTDQDRSAATIRMLTWYLHTADAADRILAPNRRHLQLEPPEPACRPLAFTSYSRALAWCDAEHANLAAATVLAADAGQHAMAWGIPAALWSFYTLRKPWDEWIASSRIGLAAARHLHDRHGEAATLNSLALAYYDLRRFPEALDHCQQVLAITREAGDRQGEGASVINLGTMYMRLHRLDEALRCYEQSLVICREIADRYREALALNNMGEVYSELGRCEQALGCFRQALTVWHEIGDKYGEADSLHNCGDVSGALGRPDDAQLSYQRALALRREIGDRLGEATTLHRLGGLWDAAGQAVKAREAWNQALDIYRDLGHPQATELRSLLEPPAEAGSSA